MNIQALLSHALQLCQQGSFVEAKNIYSKLQKTIPNNSQLLTNLGTVELKLGNYLLGIELLRKSTRLNPNQLVALLNLGNALLEQACYEESLEFYNKCILLNSNYAIAYYNRGRLFSLLNEYKKAVTDYKKAISIDPGNLIAYNNLGFALNKLKFNQEAIECYDYLIRLNPNFSEVYLNRGVAFHDLKKYDEALLDYDKAILLKPDYAEAYSNRGNTLYCLGRYDEALLDYDKAILLKPDYAEAYFYKSLIKLLFSEYIEGWQLYESRWKEGQLKNKLRVYSKPSWLGEESLDGKTILIYPEQGYGDLIQFCRYVPLLEKMGAKVILETPASLVELMESLSPTLTVIKAGEALPAFDFVCPMMSLPLALKTTLQTIPANIPYLSVSDSKRQLWKEILGKKTKPRVGIVWSGSVEHKNDHNRSLDFKCLRPILELPFEFHSIQKEVRDSDLDALNKNKHIYQHNNQLESFLDTAAIIQEMDLIISVDTSVSHLAGALGKKLFILLPFSPDFRWMLHRDDSPWYRTATLFRQSKNNSWEEVIFKLIEELKYFFKTN